MKHHHIAIFLLLGAITTFVALIIGNIYSEIINKKTPTQLGVSFSPSYAKELNLDPQFTYISILKDLHIKNIRLTAYWDEIEPKKDQYDFSGLDFYINQATQNGARI